VLRKAVLDPSVVNYVNSVADTDERTRPLS
jgi:hypothetical protein